MDEFLTEEHYLTAEANGISRKNAYQRWYHYGWEIERAITEPLQIQNQSEWMEWKDIAQKNGVYVSLFWYRLRQGMTPEQAATIPVKKRGNYQKSPRKRGKYAKLPYA